MLDKSLDPLEEDEEEEKVGLFPLAIAVERPAGGEPS